MTPCYRVRGTRQDWVPPLVCTVTVEHFQRSHQGNPTGSPVSIAAVAARLSIREANTYRLIDHAVFESDTEYWRWIDGCGRAKQRCYIFMPACSDVLTMLGFWSRVEREELTIWRRVRCRVAPGPDGMAERRRKSHPLIVSGWPDVVGWNHGPHQFRAVGLRQFGDPDPFEMRSALGWGGDVPTAQGHSAESPMMPAWYSCELTHAYMLSILDRWHAAGAGRWRDTAGAAAWQTFIRQGDCKELVVHTDPDAIKLEEEACHGGRATVFYGGCIGSEYSWKRHQQAPPVKPDTPRKYGSVYRWDMKAYYPSILHTQQFPVRLIRRYGPTDPDKLQAVCEYFGVVASVRIRSDRSETPCRAAGGLSFPAGQFDTTLAGPELKDALARGEVVSCKSYCKYELGRPFSRWAEWALSLRAREEARGNKAGAAWAKAVANALPGRLAARKVGWEDRPNERARVPWGEWHYRDPDTQDWQRWRALEGHCQLYTQGGGRTGLLTACHAYCVSYGRLFMAQIRERLPAQSVIWQHTDGIVVDSRAHRCLQRWHGSRRGQPGALQYKERIGCGRWLTPGHVWAEGRWTLSGVGSGFRIRIDGLIDRSIIVNPIRRARDPRHHPLVEIVSTIDPATIEGIDRVGDDGWRIAPYKWVGPGEENVGKPAPSLFDT